MKKRFLFSLTRVVVSYMFYFTFLLGIVSLVWGVMGITSAWNKPIDSLQYDSSAKSTVVGAILQEMSLGSTDDVEVSSMDAPLRSDDGPVLSADGRTAYMPSKNHFGVSTVPDSSLGYCIFLFRLASISIVVLIFWNLKRIFRDLSLKELFRGSVVKRLKVLALLFVAFDFVRWLHYIMFNHFIAIALPEAHLKMTMDVGRGLFVALIIWVIIMVYERGISFQQENALTI
jgi:hypothetical protein